MTPWKFQKKTAERFPQEDAVPIDSSPPATARNAVPSNVVARHLARIVHPVARTLTRILIPSHLVVAVQIDRDLLPSDSRLLRNVLTSVLCLRLYRSVLAAEPSALLTKIGLESLAQQKVSP